MRRFASRRVGLIATVLLCSQSHGFADISTPAPVVATQPGVADFDTNGQVARSPAWLRWQLPPEWRAAEEQRRVFLAGVALIATDRYTVRLFDTDHADPLRTVDWTFRPFNKLADGLVLGTGLTLAWSV